MRSDLNRGRVARWLSVVGLAAVLVAQPNPLAQPGLAPRAAEAAVGPDQSAAAPPRDEIDAARAGIQASLEVFTQALRAGDKEQLNSILDQRSGNATFRRIVTRDFAERSAVRLTLLDVRPAMNGYYKASVGFGSSGYQQTMVFRQDGDRWLLTEPLEAELGQRRLKRTEHFGFRYFEWDEDQIERLAEIFEHAATSDIAKFRVEPTGQIFATVSPTYQVNPSLSGYGYANYISGTLHVHAPDSYGFGLHSPETVDDTFLWALQHEYGHHLTRVKTRERGVPPWLDEGISDWLGSQFWRSTIRRGFSSGTIPEAGVLDWANKPIGFKDEHPGFEVELGYGLGANAVRYIVEERGGVEQLHALLDRYTATRKFDESIQDVFGQSWPDFQAAYRAWLQAWVQA